MWFFFAGAEDDLAMRLKWSVTPKFGDANHPPVLKIKGPAAISVVHGTNRCSTAPLTPYQKVVITVH